MPMTPEKFRKTLLDLKFPEAPEAMNAALGEIFGLSRSTAYRALKNGPDIKTGIVMSLLLAQKAGMKYDDLAYMVASHSKELR